MKTFYCTLVLLVLASTTFSQTYFVYTAKKSGYWYDPTNWNIQPRTDGKPKHKVVIPKSQKIIVDNNVNNMGLGDVEVFVSGKLEVVHNTTLTLSVNSSIQLDDGSIEGNAADQKILIGGVLKYSGDLDHEKKEYSIAHNLTGIAPNGFQLLSMLPVNFTSFLISKSPGNVQLSWSTDKEVGNSHFEVQRSLDGLDWVKIAVVFGAGNSNNTHNYSYNDKISTNAVVYYRLRQVDIDSRSVYSSIKAIRDGEVVSNAKIYGSEKNVVIDLNTPAKNSLVVSVLNTSGHVVTRKTIDNPSYKIKINLQNVSRGAYIVQVADNKGWTEVKKVIL